MKPVYPVAKYELFCPTKAKRCLASVLLYLSLALSSSNITAQEHANITFLLSADSEPYQIFRSTIDKLESESNKPINKYQFIYPGNTTHDDLRREIENSNLVVTAGEKSTRIFMALDLNTTHIATLLSQEEFISIKNNTHSGPVSTCAIVADQPFKRVLSVIKNKLPDINSIGFIEERSYKDPKIKKTALYDKIEFRTVHESFSDDIHSAIAELKRNGAEIIVAQNRKDIYNRNTARNILISSYHYNLPIIGFSNSFVRAGALLGVYSGPGSLAKEVFDLSKTMELCRGGNIFYAAEYTVEINPYVSKSLGINIDTSSLEKTYNDRFRE